MAALLTAAAPTASGSPATVQQTMDRLIDPAADALWASVRIVETRGGETKRVPRTAADWRKVARQAEILVQGASNLQRTGLPVGGDGHSRLADAGVPGTRTAAQIRADIDRDPQRFKRAARRLQTAGMEALAAIAARDPVRLTMAGASIDAACEACHSAYWYPRNGRLRLPPPEEFGRHAAHS